MRRKQWQDLFFIGLSLVFLSAVAYANDPTTSSPVVAPVPSGTSPSDMVAPPNPPNNEPPNPSVSTATPPPSPSDDVSYPSPIPISTNTAPGNNP